jgi:hypothetical protein
MILLGPPLTSRLFSTLSKIRERCSFKVPNQQYQLDWRRTMNNMKKSVVAVALLGLGFAGIGSAQPQPVPQLVPASNSSVAVTALTMV